MAGPLIGARLCIGPTLLALFHKCGPCIGREFNHVWLLHNKGDSQQPWLEHLKEAVETIAKARGREGLTPKFVGLDGITEITAQSQIVKACR